MTWWPGWDSIENAKGWADFYFWFGIGCLVLLAVSGVISHRYGLRKDELVSAAEVTASKERKVGQDVADAFNAIEIDGLKRRLSEAEKKLSEVEKQQTWRLSDAEKQALIGDLARFPGQKVKIVCLVGDSQSLAMANDFLEVFRAANWNDGGGSGIDQVVLSAEPGIKVTISDWDGAAGVATPGAVHLITALTRFGFIRESFHGPGIEPGAIELQVRSRPPRL